MVRLDEDKLERIIDYVFEAFEDICDREGVQVFEEDYENIKEGIESIRGVGY